MSHVFSAVPRWSILVAATLLPASVASAGNLSWSPPSHKAAPKGDPLTPRDAGYVDPGAYPGPVAEQRAGQVVFSSAPIAMTASDDAAAITTWDLSGPLYARFFGAESPQNLLPTCSDQRFFTEVMVNPAEGAAFLGDAVTNLRIYRLPSPAGRPYSTLTPQLADSFNVPTVWTFNGDPATDPMRVFNSAVVPQLVPGDNTIRMRVVVACADRAVQVAEGALQVTATAASKAAWLRTYGTRLPTPAHPENATVSRQAVSIMRADTSWQNEQILGAQVIDAQWEPVREPVTGVLVARQVQVLLITHAKAEPNPDVCEGYNLGFSRDVAGGSLRYEGVGIHWPLPCGSVSAGGSKAGAAAAGS